MFKILPTFPSSTQTPPKKGEANQSLTLSKYKRVKRYTTALVVGTMCLLGKEKSQEEPMVVRPLILSQETLHDLPGEQIAAEANRIIESEKLESLNIFSSEDLNKINYYSLDQQERIKSTSENLESVVSDLAYARAKYNLTRDASAFNKYLPYQDSIQNDPVKLKEYEDLVKLICEKLHVIKVYDEKKKGRQIIMERTALADPSTLYITAAQIAELFHNQQQLVDRTLSRLEKLEIRLGMSPGDNSAYYYGGKSGGTIVVGNGFLWYQLIVCHYTILHEFVHVIDALGPPYPSLPIHDQEGLIYEMRDIKDLLLTRFLQARENLSEIAGYRNLSEEDMEKKVKEKYIEPSTGLPRHCFFHHDRGYAEFHATTIGTFYESPELFFTEGEDPRARKLKMELYEIYRTLFRFDPKLLPSKL